MMQDIDDKQKSAILSHLMTSLENWRASERLKVDALLIEEEKELRHAYDLLQRLIASKEPG